MENERILRIHNIYNPGGQETDGLNALQEVLIRNKDSEQIMLRDFNLHHPHWGGLDAYLDKRTEHLILMAEEFAIEQALLVGTVTYEENC